MTRLLLAATALALWAAPASAQADALPQGTVVYEVRNKTTVGEIPPEMEHLRAQLEQETVQPLRVQFHGATALGVALPPQGDGAETETPMEGGGTMRTRVQLSAHGLAGAQDFVDVDQERRLSQTEMFDRVFLIEEPLAPFAWRLTGETREFLGYEVHKATAETPRGTVEAWFAPQIPAPVGPGAYVGLPGLVLLVSEPGGRRSYAAQSVDLTPLAAPPAPPREGRRVSREEFVKMQEEQIERLRRMGGSVTVIRPN